MLSRRFYGKALYDELAVPIGLVSSNWGATAIEPWMDPATNALCNTTDAMGATVPLPPPLRRSALGSQSVAAGPQPNTPSVLFNAMIHPFAVGPMGVSSIIWWQGENNLYTRTNYSCQQKALITSWRRWFNAPTAFFGCVALRSCGCPCQCCGLASTHLLVPDLLFQMRQCNARCPTYRYHGARTLVWRQHVRALTICLCAPFLP